MSTSIEKRYALFGYPIKHSLSPMIYADFGKQLGLDIDYRIIECEPDQFISYFQEFDRSGGVGANVTLPHKISATTLCYAISDQAKIAGAVNVLKKTNEGWYGDNTDGSGFVRDLTERHALDIRERRTLILGAGGAARGIIPALLDAGIHDICIVNRNSQRADELIDAIGIPDKVYSRYLDDTDELGAFDLVINASSAGHDTAYSLDLPFSLLHSRTVCYDLSYGNASIAFTSWAHAANAHQVFDGLGMLVEQAADAFKLWHGKRPTTDSIYRALDKHFGNPE